MRVSDIITKEEIGRWEPGDNIGISSGLGSGKSYMCKNTLYEVAKENNEKILMLIHRTNCVQQFIAEIEASGKNDVMEIITYQKLENDIMRKHGRYDLKQYKYIVNDEFHYFFNDSAFNNKTAISFEAIMNQESAVRIFMSATGECMTQYMEQYIFENNLRSLKKYTIPADYSYISELNFFHNDSSIKGFIKQALERNEKIIVFMQSAEKAYRLFCEYKDVSVFNCGESSRFHRYVDKNKISQILCNEKFDEPVLITTASFDSGINLIDRELRNIVIDMTDIGSLIQCIGRKRIQDKNDTITLYIKSINNQRLSGLRQSMRKQLEMADFFIANDYSILKLLEKYPMTNDKTDIIYDYRTDGETYTKRVNNLMYWKKKYDIKLFTKMIDEYDGFGYCKYLAKLFGFYDKENKMYTYKTVIAGDPLEEYLESMVGQVMLQRGDRKELIGKIDARSGGHRLNRIDSLNEAIEKRGLKYRIVEFQTSRMIKKEDKTIKKNYKNAWKVIKI